MIAWWQVDVILFSQLQITKEFIMYVIRSVTFVSNMLKSNNKFFIIKLIKIKENVFSCVVCAGVAGWDEHKIHR